MAVVVSVRDDPPRTSTRQSPVVQIKLSHVVPSIGRLRWSERESWQMQACGSGKEPGHAESRVSYIDKRYLTSTQYCRSITK